MAQEALQPIADAVAAEVARFEAEYGMDLGADVTVDEQAGSVSARGGGLRKWGPQQVIVGALTRAGLRHDIFMQSATIVVYPSTDQAGAAAGLASEPNRDAAIALLRRELVANGTTPEARHRGPADGGDLPLHQLLRPLVQGGNLARGTIVAAPPRPEPSRREQAAWLGESPITVPQLDSCGLAATAALLVVERVLAIAGGAQRLSVVGAGADLLELSAA